MRNVKLCVNVDHVATLRQARGGHEPDPVKAAIIAEKAGANGITVHLREDRRHIQDNDLYRLKEVVKGKFNLEMALSEEIVKIAHDLSPEQVTLVPENRAEITTEGGLDVKSNYDRIAEVAAGFKKAGILVSLFIEPDIETVELSGRAGVEYVEFHTGNYVHAEDERSVRHQLDCLFMAAERAVELNIRVNAGHGLNYENVKPVLDMPKLEELNIGHSIVSYAVFSGFQRAVTEMLELMETV